MSVSRKNRNMKKSSRSRKISKSKNGKRSKTNRRMLKQMRGGVVPQEHKKLGFLVYNDSETNPFNALSTEAGLEVFDCNSSNYTENPDTITVKLSDSNNADQYIFPKQYFELVDAYKYKLFRGDFYQQTDKDHYVLDEHDKLIKKIEIYNCKFHSKIHIRIKDKSKKIPCFTVTDNYYGNKKNEEKTLIHFALYKHRNRTESTLVYKVPINIFNIELFNDDESEFSKKLDENERDDIVKPVEITYTPNTGQKTKPISDVTNKNL